MAPKKGFEWSTVLLLVFVLGIGLRLFGLGFENIWMDEGISIQNALKGDFADKYRGAIDLLYLPVYHLSLGLWISWFGTEEMVVRLWSALFSILSLPLMFLLGSQLFNRKTGIIATLILAISSYHLYYAQEVRSYAMVVFFSLLSLIFLFRWLKAQKVTDLVWYTVATTLLVLTQVFSILLVVAQGALLLGLFAFNQKIKIMHWFAAMAVLALVVIQPLIDLVKVTLGIAGSFWIGLPGVQGLIKTFYFFSAGQTNTLISLAAGGLLSLIFVGLAAWCVWKTWQKISFKKLGAALQLPVVQLLFVLIVPIVVLFVASYLFNPFYLPRYIIFCSIPFYLMIAHSIEQFSQRIRTVAIVIVIILSLTLVSMDYTTQSKGASLDAAQFVLDNRGPDDVVVVSAAFARYSLGYYGVEAGCFGNLDEGCWAENGLYPTTTVAELPDESAFENKKVFLVLFNEKHTDPQGTLVSYFENRGTLLETETPKNFNIRVYDLTQ